MTSDRLDEYFVGEAGDYLDQLRTLLTGSSWPDARELVRLATGVRGSTRMAGADEISTLAGALEDAARALDDGHLAPSDEILAAIRETESDLRYLLAAIPEWSADQSDRVHRCLDRWSAVTGEPERPVVSISDPLLNEADTGVVGPAGHTPEDRPVLPIGALLYEPSPPSAIPISTLFHDAPDEESSALAAGSPSPGAVEQLEEGVVVPIEALGFDDPDEATAAVPIEALLLDATIPSEPLAEPPVVPIASLLSEETDEIAVVPVESLLVDEESLLVDEDGEDAVVPIESLLASESDDLSVTPLAAPAGVALGMPGIVEDPTAGDDFGVKTFESREDPSPASLVDLVPIESLLLRGDSAIRQALAMRDAIERAAHDPSAESNTLPDLVTELFELLELSLVADPPEA